MHGWQYRAHGVSLAITLREDGRWVVWVDDVPLGSYHRADAALEDLCGGHCGGGVDTARLPIPRDLRRWVATH